MGHTPKCKHDDQYDDAPFLHGTSPPLDGVHSLYRMEVNGNVELLFPFPYFYNSMGWIGLSSDF
jgi:hypothetical protein